jgi:hypothetical protein
MVLIKNDIGGVLGGSLAADVLAVLEAQLYRVHSLFAQIVRSHPFSSARVSAWRLFRRFARSVGGAKRLPRESRILYYFA